MPNPNYFYSYCTNLNPITGKEIGLYRWYVEEGQSLEFIEYYEHGIWNRLDYFYNGHYLPLEEPKLEMGRSCHKEDWDNNIAFILSNLKIVFKRLFILRKIKTIINNQ